MRSFKFRIIALVICMSALLTGCGVCHHDIVHEATCVDCATCEKCGKTFGKPIGHATNSGYCYRCEDYVNCLKLDNEMVGEIKQRCSDTALAASVDMKAVTEKTGLEFKPETAQISALEQDGEYLMHVEFSIEAEGLDAPLVISRNFYAIDKEDGSEGWTIGFHDEYGK